MGNVNHCKSFHHPTPTRGNRKHSGNFQNKSVSCPFSWVPRYILFLDKLKERGRPFLDGAESGATLWNYPQEMSHWPCFTWKFFMICFHKILQLIFQKQPSCPRTICTEHWRKLPNLTAFLESFLYLKNNDSDRTCVKSFVNCAIHLFPR